MIGALCVLNLHKRPPPLLRRVLAFLSVTRLASEIPTSFLFMAGIVKNAISTWIGLGLKRGLGDGSCLRAICKK